MNSSNIRVRFAPSPTGEFHIGGLRTALYNWLFAKQAGGRCILRIEDTDRTRLVPGAEERLIGLLDTFGLQFDEGPHAGGQYGPYRQSDRLEIYQRKAEDLIHEKKAYYCTCPPERLEKLRAEQQSRGEAPHYDGQCRELAVLKPAEPFVIRMRLMREGVSTVTDVVHGQVEFQNRTLDDFVLLKADGFPTYHLASVVDDHLMEISHVIRGDEWFPSLPKHVALYQAFGWSLPVFVHLPLILGTDRQKLSKRHGAASVQEFLDHGFLPAAILNFLALLGWHPSDDRERYTLDDLVSAFSLERLQKAPAVFNREKLLWFNATYIRSLDAVTFQNLSKPFLNGRLLPELESKLAEALDLVRDRVQVLSELPELLSFVTKGFSLDPALLPYKTMTNQEAGESLEFSRQLLEQYRGDWTAVKLETTWKQAMADQGKAIGSILWPLRAVLTGKKASPGTFDVLAVLGPKLGLERIEHGIRLLGT